ncbi:tRNA-binding protein [Xenorhabdus bovienii]|uniref:Protein secretion chaperonin n=5 Tax=Xenorhabdus TaxID=626 RepID=A0A077PN94_XENBV|nr:MULTISPECIES: tRNA-binding protein [Xenorhabdus]MCP9268484.1 tRNA-binding protein [Xenorhabdus bovienii subsp. africana]MDC9621332.1 tRNA-binding protein [Xenorhabdus aichiensis]MDE1480524.1 tRNA-binding protein [Xenorhabdus bovienii]MDE1486317.1 tRNA-binding protein [Xenorhabdus bovienii]MDE1492963.1 tRNA-binding protein [Xenorhabdus bovienii]
MENIHLEPATFDAFMSLDIRVGKIIKAEKNEKAIKPAYKLYIDFGSDIGEKQSSAQICQNYTEEQLIGKQVLAVVNFPPRRVAGFKSEVLVLAAVCDDQGTVLLQPERDVTLGTRML